MRTKEEGDGGRGGGAEEREERRRRGEEEHGSPTLTSAFNVSLNVSWPSGAVSPRLRQTRTTQASGAPCKPNGCGIARSR